MKTKPITFRLRWDGFTYRGTVHFRGHRRRVNRDVIDDYVGWPADHPSFLSYMRWHLGHEADFQLKERKRRRRSIIKNTSNLLSLLAKQPVSSFTDKTYENLKNVITALRDRRIAGKRRSERPLIAPTRPDDILTIYIRRDKDRSTGHASLGDLTMIFPDWGPGTKIEHSVADMRNILTLQGSLLMKRLDGD